MESAPLGAAGGSPPPPPAVQIIRHPRLLFGVQMGIGRHGHLHRVTQALGHGDNGVPQVHHQGGMAVPLRYNNRTKAGTLDLSGVPAFLVTNVLQVQY